MHAHKKYVEAFISNICGNGTKKNIAKQEIFEGPAKYDPIHRFNLYLTHHKFKLNGFEL